MIAEAMLYEYEGSPLQIKVANVQSLPEDEYALVRRQGIGASDISVLLGVNLYKGVEDLLLEKRSTEITDAEREVKKKEVVRKGFDLESLILEKFAKLYNCAEPLKPQNMYCLKDFPFLTINYDGVLCNKNGDLVPVECKYISPWGDKYYNREVALVREFGETPAQHNLRAVCGAPYYQLGTDKVDYLKRCADVCGIPVYYYTQVQQQLLGTAADYGLLAALHDKGWELTIHYVARNPIVQDWIKVEGFKFWNKV